MSGFTSTDRPVGYRSNQHRLHSSSDDDSEEGDEDTPLWRQKKEKYFRKQKDNQSSMQTQIQRDSGQFMQQSKKMNNIWGSVLTEQDLTQSLVSSAAVDKPNELSVNERNVESYDFTKKYTDERPGRHCEPSSTDWSSRNIPLPDSVNTSASSSRGRSIIDYEDTVAKPKECDDLRTHLSRKSRKRRADFSGDRKHHRADFSGDRKQRSSDLHRRLGDKKLTTTRLGDIDITVDMEDSMFVKKVADFLNEPKSELIERTVEHLGKDVALRILKATKDVEETGGMYTMDGSRRRTAGGVYFTLLKQQPEFNNKVRSLIFVDDIEAFKKRRKERRAQAKAKKRAGKTAQGNKKNNDKSMTPVEQEDVKKDQEEMEDGEIPDDGDDKIEDGKDLTNQTNHSDSSDSSSDDNSPKSKKSGNLSFEEELAAAKKLILEKSKSSESMEDKSTVEMTDLEVAEAHVVDIEIDG